MIIVRKTIGKGFAPEILKKQFPYEIVFGGETKYFTEEDIKELQSKLNEFFIPDVSSRLPFKEELDNMCKHYIETTEKEDKGKWHDNTITEKVKHWCKWMKIFAKENGY
jgi:hypothetical protein